MKKSWVKKGFVCGIIFLFVGTSFIPGIGGMIKDENDCDVSPISSKNEDDVKLTFQSTENGTEFTYTISGLSMKHVLINEGEYTRVTLAGESNTMMKGFPDIPNICRSIIIPDGAEMAFRIINANYKEYHNILIVPSKGVIPRSITPEAVSYEFGEIYRMDTWFPEKVVELGDPYLLRDFRGLVLKVYPVQYNPFTKNLRVYSDITFEVFPITHDEITVYSPGEPFTSLDQDFLSIYRHHFVNYPMGRYALVGEQGTMLVITYDGFWDEMLPFVQWKNMKGIPTEMVNVSTIGTASNIKNYITDYYTNHGLTFVLLVGDAAQVPSLMVNGYPSDPSYSYIVGADHYPDVFVGRFSAETAAQVETQVQRSTDYEKYPQMNGEWYQKGAGVASSQGPGDDGEYDWEHMRTIRTDLLDFNYSMVDELYDGSHGGEDASGNPSSSMVASVVNAGRGLINYCGHGSVTSWSTSGFSNSDVNALLNVGCLPFICSVACYNGRFDSGTCFAEAWLRATLNGEPTGAVAVFMSSKSQGWDPPMDAQDEIVDILVGSYSDNKKNTFGGLMFSGCMHMNDMYGYDGSVETDAWHVFGDPSLQVWTHAPDSMIVEHDPLVFLGSSSFSVVVEGVENALCAISSNGSLLGYAYTDSFGQAVIPLDDRIMGLDVLDFVVTASNKIPYITTLNVSGTSYSLSFVSGWNLITVPMSNLFYASSLAENISGCQMVSWFDSVNQTYKTYIVGGPPSFDFPIVDGFGYFVLVNLSSTLSLSGIRIDNVSVPLSVGWDLVGWYHSYQTTASSLAGNISGCQMVSWFDSVNQSFKTFIVGGPPSFDFTVSAGMGLFVLVDESSVWQGEG